MDSKVAQQPEFGPPRGGPPKPANTPVTIKSPTRRLALFLSTGQFQDIQSHALASPLFGKDVYNLAK